MIKHTRPRFFARLSHSCTLAGLFSSAILLSIAAASVSPAHAVSFTGTRSTSNGAIIADDAWAPNNGGFRIDFTVSQIGSLWKYDYHFSAADGSSLCTDISRFIKLEVSQNVPSAMFEYLSDGHTSNYHAGDLVPLTPSTSTFKLWDSTSSSNSYSLYSVYVGDNNDSKSDELSDNHLVIFSSQAPMWGSFYVRGGDDGHGPAEAVNRGFNGGVFKNPNGGTYSKVNSGMRPLFDPAQDPNASSVKYWILVPDTRTQIVPEPTSIALCLPLAALGLLAVTRRVRNRPRMS